MHPGWAQTPGLQASLTAFAQALEAKLRTPEQGADTIVWAAVSEQVKFHPNGSFLFGNNL